jgi:integrase
VSDYEAKVVTPEQMIAILEQLDRPETKLVWTLALVHAATALRPDECFALKWWDIDPANNQILAQRAWSKGRETDSKTKGSMKSFAMHPGLAEFLNEWRKASCYNRDDDWGRPSPFNLDPKLVYFTSSISLRRHVLSKNDSFGL